MVRQHELRLRDSVGRTDWVGDRLWLNTWLTRWTLNRRVHVIKQLLNFRGTRVRTKITCSYIHVHAVVIGQCSGDHGDGNVSKVLFAAIGTHDRDSQ